MPSWPESCLHITKVMVLLDVPAVSKDQQIAMAIAEHNPSKLNSKNKGLLKMSKSSLHDFASTPRKGLPKKVSK